MSGGHNRRVPIGIVAGVLFAAFVVVVGVALAASSSVMLGGTRPETPAVSGGRVVWVDRTYGNADIFLYDAGTGLTSRLTTDPADQTDPAISGNIVVWSDHRTGKGTIRALDLSTGIEREVSPNVSDQVRPSISGSWIVWEDCRNSYSPAIYGYDLSAGVERRIASGTTSAHRPKVCGNLVVWEDYSNGANGGDIKAYDLSTGVTSVISATPNSELLPDTDGRYVVWAEAAPGGMNVAAYDTATGARIDVATQTGEQTFPSISNGKVYWSDNVAHQRLHVDSYDLASKTYARFDDRGVADITGFVARDGGAAWLSRRGASWQVVAQSGGVMAQRVAGLFKALVAVPGTVVSAPAGIPVQHMTVVRTSVVDGQRKVSLRPRLSVTFSRAVSSSAANLRRIYLRDERRGTVVPTRLSFDSTHRAVFLLPTARLRPGLYSIVVDSQLLDSKGGQIADPAQVTFATLMPLGTDVTPPSAPRSPVARVDTRANVTLVWSPATDDVGVVGYDVYRSNTPTQMSDYTTQGTLVTSVVTTGATFPIKSDEATKAYTYNYIVVAKDAAGNKTPSINALPDPHGISAKNVSTCTACHSSHGGSAPFLGAASATACYVCHGTTSGTAAYGYAAAMDTQARFQDDSVIATQGPTRIAGPTGSVHRNAMMVTNGHDCDSCHTPHRKPYDPTPSVSYRLVLRSQIATLVPTSTPSAAYRYNTETTATGNDICFDCHGSAADNASTLIGLVGGASAYSDAGGDHRTNWTNTAHGMASKVPTPAGDLPTPSIQCLACHDEHGSKVPKLLGSFDATNGVSRMIYGSTPTTLTGNDKSVCYGCHTNATTNFPTASENASGYPMQGTWPGKATWETTYSPATHLGSFHATSTDIWSGSGQAGGDCKNCHVMHGGDSQNVLDILRRDVPGSTTYAPSTFAFCFKCHGGSGPGLDDIKRYYPTAAGGGATQTSVTRFGHKTLSAGTLPAGSALPCYDCHNPHGSASAYGLLVVTQSAGTTFAVGDGSGELTMTPSTRTAVDIRHFCLTCHTTADNATGWNGSAYAVVTAPAKVEGIDRTTYSAAGARLRLPSITGHNSADVTSCYTCHGNDYSSATSNNVHNPAGGVSNGGQPCYGCHGNFKDTMDMAGLNKTANYHHVVGTSTAVYTGDATQVAGIYPTSTINVFCLSCHVDHNYFNDGTISYKGSNLRTNIDSGTLGSGLATANTDFVASNNRGGICTSCHRVTMTKRTTYEKNDGISSITPRVDPVTFTVSAHNYSVATSFGPNGTDVFNPNCSKCHNDEQTKSFQTGTYQFGTHYSGDRRLLAAFGATVVDPVIENDCFGCHSQPSDAATVTPKPVLGRDAYGTLGHAMDTTSQLVFKVMNRNLQSRHGSVPTYGYITCLNCHNPHVSTATTKVVDPFNTYNAISFNTTDTKDTFCLKCHTSGPYPAYGVSSTSFVPVSMTINGGWTVDKATYGARGHWTANGSISSTERVPCTTCHDKHGSVAPFLLGVYNPATGNNEISGTVITADDNTVCYACHTNGSTGFPTYSKDASGYPTDGTYPGKSTYTTSQHQGFLCTQCHDVHGTASTYDELGAFSTTNFTLCLTCHGGVFVDVKRYFPTTVGGGATQTSTSRFGHKTLSAGFLPAGSALPCYDCHNPHGSADTTSMLEVVTQSNGTTYTIGDQAGEISTATADGVRKFCFACHTTADTGQGWNGAAWQAVLATDKFEGIVRTPYNSAGAHLRLPSVSGHNFADVQSCYQCHGNDYSSATSNNVHNPTGGVSGGGTTCYSCHSGFKNPMESYGSSATLNYHHVLGSSVSSGDVAPATGSYTTSTTAVYCVSCHTDHNYFNGSSTTSPAANLRQDIANSSGAVATYTDFLTSGSYGICVSCHSVSITKDNANQKSTNASSKTPTIPGPDFVSSAHQYIVSSTFGSSTFRANCVKCHDDGQVTVYQTGTYTFSLHFSSEARLLDALGVAVPASGMTEEALCYACHSGAGTLDGYGVAAMTANSKSLATEFASTYKHPIAATSGVHRGDENLATATRHVECEDCHEPHASQAGTHTPGASAAGKALRGVDGVMPTFGASNWTSPTAYVATRNAGSALDYEAYVCFKCHTTYTTLPTSGGSGGFGGTNLGMEFNPNNQSGHSILGSSDTWPKTTFGGYTFSSMTPTATFFVTTYISNMGPNYKMTCSDCHTYDAAGASGPHGSSSKFITRKGGATDWYATTLSTWSSSGANFLCGQCHAYGTNNVHTRSDHSSYTCERCHIRIPHGWKRPRLLVRYGTDPAPYVTTTSNSLAGFTNASHTTAGWARGDCNAGCYGQHNASGLWP